MFLFAVFSVFCIIVLYFMSFVFVFSKSLFTYLCKGLHTDVHQAQMMFFLTQHMLVPNMFHFNLPRSWTRLHSKAAIACQCTRVSAKLPSSFPLGSVHAVILFEWLWLSLCFFLTVSVCYVGMRRLRVRSGTLLQEARKTISNVGGR